MPWVVRRQLVAAAALLEVDPEASISRPESPTTCWVLRGYMQKEVGSSDRASAERNSEAATIINATAVERVSTAQRQHDGNNSRKEWDGMHSTAYQLAQLGPGPLKPAIPSASNTATDNTFLKTPLQKPDNLLAGASFVIDTDCDSHCGSPRAGRDGASLLVLASSHLDCIYQAGVHSLPTSEALQAVLLSTGMDASLQMTEELLRHGSTQCYGAGTRLLEAWEGPAVVLLVLSGTCALHYPGLEPAWNSSLGLRVREVGAGTFLGGSVILFGAPAWTRATAGGEGITVLAIPASILLDVICVAQFGRDLKAAIEAQEISLREAVMTELASFQSKSAIAWPDATNLLVHKELAELATHVAAGALSVSDAARATTWLPSELRKACLTGSRECDSSLQNHKKSMQLQKGLIGATSTVSVRASYTDALANFRVGQHAHRSVEGSACLGEMAARRCRVDGRCVQHEKRAPEAELAMPGILKRGLKQAQRHLESQKSNILRAYDTSSINFDSYRNLRVQAKMLAQPSDENWLHSPQCDSEGHSCASNKWPPSSTLPEAKIATERLCENGRYHMPSEQVLERYLWDANSLAARCIAERNAPQAYTLPIEHQDYSKYFQEVRARKEQESLRKEAEEEAHLRKEQWHKETRLWKMAKVCSVFLFAVKGCNSESLYILTYVGMHLLRNVYYLGLLCQL
jgi:hypothetical protein